MAVSRHIVLAACLAYMVQVSLAAPRPWMSVEATSACRCTREFNAVCGNDGQTYSNKCLLECARAQGSSRMGQDLRIAKMGSC